MLRNKLYLAMLDVLRYHHLIHGYFCIFKRNHPLGFDKISHCHLNHSMFWLSIQFHSIKNTRIRFTYYSMKSKSACLSTSRSDCVECSLLTTTNTLPKMVSERLTRDLLVATCKLHHSQFSTVEGVAQLGRLINI